MEVDFIDLFLLGFRWARDGENTSSEYLRAREKSLHRFIKSAQSLE